jgi:hypothetical protein
MGKNKIGKNGVYPDRERLDSLRAQLPAVSVAGYFNAGSNGPIPRPAHEILIRQAVQELEAGRCDLAFYGERVSESAGLRGTIAGIFNSRVSEVALMRSTTEGMNAALNGVFWQPGDEIITTQLEHPGLFVAIASVSHRHGVTVRTVNIGNGGGDVLAEIAAATTPRTRVIAISHVQWTSGAIMPLAEIAEFARERGILTIIDGSVSMSIARPAKSGSADRTAPDSCFCARIGWVIFVPPTSGPARLTPLGTSRRHRARLDTKWASRMVPRLRPSTAACSGYGTTSGSSG